MPTTSDLQPLLIGALVMAAALLLVWGGLWLVGRYLGPGLLRSLVLFVPACITTVRRMKGQPLATRVKVVLFVAFLWLISPVDLVPDVLPIVGMLDDIIIAVSALRYAARNVDQDTLFNAWPEDADFLRRLLGRS